VSSIAAGQEPSSLFSTDPSHRCCTRSRDGADNVRHLLGLAVAVLPALQQTQPLSALRFDWPPGAIARVETAFQHEYSDGTLIILTSALQMTHRMRVLPHAEGRLIQYDNQTYVQSLGDLEPGVAALLPLWVPSRIVSPEGRFLRMENTERVQQNVIDLFEEKARTELAQRVPVFREYVQMMTSDAGLKALAQEHWYDLVQRWIAAPLIEGPLEGVGPQLIPIEIQPPSTISRRMIGRMPCSRLATIHECGIYEITIRRDRDQLADFARALKDSGAAAFADTELLEETKTEQVSLESSTMLPHELTITRTVRATIQLGGQTVPKIDTERVHSVFTYVDEQ
jgi:hypothetical protein